MSSIQLNEQISNVRYDHESIAGVEIPTLAFGLKTKILFLDFEINLDIPSEAIYPNNVLIT